VDATYQLRPFLSVRLRAAREPHLFRTLFGEPTRVTARATITLWFGRRWQPEEADRNGGVASSGTHQGIPWRSWIGRDPAGQSLVHFTSPLLRSYLSFHIALLPLIRDTLDTAGEALLIGSAFGHDDRATLLLGRGGSGKTRTMLRAIERGAAPIADEYFSVGSSGAAHALLHVVGLRENVRRQAPRLYRALPPARKVALAALRASGLLVRPPVLLHATWGDLGLATPVQRDWNITRVWWLDPAAGTDGVRELSAAEMARRAVAHLAAHDRWYRPAGGHSTPAADDPMLDVLTRAFGAAECHTGPAEAVPLEAPAAATDRGRVGARV